MPRRSCNGWTVVVGQHLPNAVAPGPLLLGSGISSQPCLTRALHVTLVVKLLIHRPEVGAVAAAVKCTDNESIARLMVSAHMWDTLSHAFQGGKLVLVAPVSLMHASTAAARQPPFLSHCCRVSARSLHLALLGQVQRLALEHVEQRLGALENLRARYIW